jgi:hypothetical protein
VGGSIEGLQPEWSRVFLGDNGVVLGSECLTTARGVVSIYSAWSCPWLCWVSSLFSEDQGASSRAAGVTGGWRDNLVYLVVSDRCRSVEWA